jgi:hypothetical protein
MNFRYLSAGMGLLAAAGALVFVFTRLLQAGVPQATPLKVVNDGSAVLVISRVSWDGSVVSGPALRLTAGAERSLDGRELAPGRPTHLALSIEGANGVAVCEAVRPAGPCTLEARLKSATELSCDHVCKPPGSLP